MTNEEALKWLDEHCLERVAKGGFEAKIQATFALEKQMPKDMKYVPQTDYFDYWGTTEWRCPVCGLPAFLQNYCSGCGQKLQFPNSETEWGDGAKDG